MSRRLTKKIFQWRQRDLERVLQDGLKNQTFRPWFLSSGKYCLVNDEDDENK